MSTPKNFFLRGDNGQSVEFEENVPQNFLVKNDLFTVIAQGPFIGATYSVVKDSDSFLESPASGYGPRWVFQLSQEPLRIANGQQYIGGGSGFKPDPTVLCLIVGDSIMTDDVNLGGYGGANAMRPFRDTKGPVVWGTYNASKPSTTSADFVPGTAIWTSNILPMLAYAANFPSLRKVVLYAIGTNDTKPGVNTSVNAYSTNAAAAAAAFAAAGCETVFLSRPLPRAGAFGGTWDSQSPARMTALNNAHAAIANNVTSFVGDRTLPLRQNADMHTVDGIHPNAAGLLLQGQTAAQSTLDWYAPPAVPPAFANSVVSGLRATPELQLSLKGVSFNQNTGNATFKNLNGTTYATQSRTIDGDNVTLGPVVLTP